MSVDIVAWAHARGSNARNLRDAVHEISHAVTIAQRGGGWSRLERSYIGAGVDLYMSRAEAFTDECLARAVERLACDEAGQPCGDFTLNSCLEAARTGVVKPPSEWAAGIAAQADAAVVRLAEIQRLITTPRTRPRKGR